MKKRKRGFSKVDLIRDREVRREDTERGGRDGGMCLRGDRK